MIAAIEGPDCSGKTTLFEALRDRCTWSNTRFVPSLPMSQELLPVMPWVERRNVHLWEHLYDPSVLYVCDRHVCVSAPVYDSVFGRPCLVEWRRWTNRLIVLYIEVPEEELRRRYAARGDEHFPESLYGACTAAYRSLVFPAFSHRFLDGTLPLEDLVLRAEEVLRCCK